MTADLSVLLDQLKEGCPHKRPPKLCCQRSEDCGWPELVALAEVAQAARCRRFDITPCEERPELREEEWCPVCAGRARLRRVLA